MFQTSNRTLNNFKSAIQDKVDQTVGNETVVRAARETLKLYAKFDRKENSERTQRTTSVLSIGSSGISLGLIGLDALTAWVTATAYVMGDIVKNNDIGYVCVVAHTSSVFATDLSTKWEVYRPLQSERLDFHMFRSDASGNFSEYDEYLPVKRGSNNVGRYIENNTVFIWPHITTSVNVVFRYFRAPVLPSENVIDLSQTLPIEVDAENPFEEFMLFRFFTKEGTQLRAQDAEARFGEMFAEFFDNTGFEAINL